MTNPVIETRWQMSQLDAPVDSKSTQPATVDSSNSRFGRAIPPVRHESTVLFCDLCDFSSMVSSTSDLSGLYERIHVALNVMATEIEVADGEISDVQGDSVLGFWHDARGLLPPAVSAVQSAMRILDRFAAARRGPAASMLAGLTPSIGISSGMALSGAMQVGRLKKNGIFGPVTNLGARLQGLTKQLGVAALVDGDTVHQLEELGTETGVGTRYCGRFRLVGMIEPVEVYELVRASDEGSRVDEFESAVRLFERGHWQAARTAFEELASDFPQSKFFLQQMAHANFVVPSDWDGTVVMTRK